MKVCKVNIKITINKMALELQLDKVIKVEELKLIKMHNPII